MQAQKLENIYRQQLEFAVLGLPFLGLASEQFALLNLGVGDGGGGYGKIIRDRYHYWRLLYTQ